MSRMIFVNLPVQDLTKAVDFFASLGFEFNEQFSDDRATCMVVSEQACVMLLVTPYFSSFTTKDVTDAQSGTEVILAVSARSREEVDTLVDRALSLGGGVAKEPSDEGYMYGRSFYDLDGHAWEVMWMDPAAVR
jgi:predicted lactoylglutathione lyase